MTLCDIINDVKDYALEIGILIFAVIGWGTIFYVINDLMNDPIRIADFHRKHGY